MATWLRKSYVVKQFHEFGEGFEGMVKALRTRSNGTIDVDDPGTDKILGMKKDIEDLVPKLKDAISSTNSKAINEELDAFVDLVKRRNDAVYTYNCALLQLSELKVEQMTYQKQGEKYGEDFIQLDKNLPVGRYYTMKYMNDVRLSVLEERARGAKAIQFWPLKTPESFDYQGYKKFPTSETLELYRMALATAFRDCLESFGKGIYNQFPKASDREECGVNARGSCYELGKDITEILKSSGLHDTIDSSSDETPTGLVGQKNRDAIVRSESKNSADSRRLYEVFSEIPLVREATSATENSLAGYWDLRIDQIRVWLFGASVDQKLPKLRVKFEHLGTVRIVKKIDCKTTGKASNVTSYANGENVFTFKHDPVVIHFEYNPLGVSNMEGTARAKILSAQNFPGVYRGQKADVRIDNLAPVGPFAQWKLSVDSAYHVNMDLSKLTGITIEFWGSTASF